MMLGFLLARAGVDVVVLEKHADFLRDFRGDTVHPSTLELMNELGVYEDFLRRPHQEMDRLSVQVGSASFWVADFRYLPTRAKCVVFMPQWDFLNFLAGHGKKYPEFHLRMQAEVTDLVQSNGVVSGVRARTPNGELIVHSALVVGADGRHSVVRERAGFRIMDKGAPMDVLWMRISRLPEDGLQSLGHVDAGRFLAMINRGDYWQCAFVIPKGAVEQVRARGIESFRQDILKIVPMLGNRVAELKSWDDVSLLTVKVDRLQTWHKPGLLCIGDAAHAMSPMGGVGINLAVQDAVAAANILAPAFASGRQLDSFLNHVQRRREFPVRITQWAQILAQNNMVSPVLAGTRPIRTPGVLKLLQRWPWLQRLPARAIGMGARPEHVKTPDVHRRAQDTAA